MTLKRTRHLDIYITIKELIEEHPDYPVNRLCKFGHITRASYYKWKNRVDNENDVLNKQIAEKMEQIHDEHPDMSILVNPEIILVLSGFYSSIIRTRKRPAVLLGDTRLRYYH